MHLSGKKLLLIGFVVILLLGIPLTIYLLQRQQEVRTRAVAATVLSFDPVSSASSPIQKNIGDKIPLNITVDPGTNLVGWIRIVIQYDPDKLATVSAAVDQAQPFTINPATSFSFFNGPVYSEGRIEAELSVGADPTKAIQSTVTLATLTLKALNGTDGSSTPVTFLQGTEALSQATSLGSGDEANENVLASTVPAIIAIAGSSTTTPTPTPSGGPPTITATPTPTRAPTTPTPTVGPSTITPTPTQGGGTGGTNQLPVCSSLNVDRATTGTAPLSLTFTANGTDSDGTITKATFNFGDGAPEEALSGGGIGTNSVAVQKAHTYNNPGNYTVTATLTDNANGVSTTSLCSQAVTVQQATSGGTSGGTTGGTTGGTDGGTIPPTGPGDVFIGIGAVAGVLSIIGAVIFFAL